MNKYSVLIICLLLCLNLRGQEQTWREVPYYLKGYEAEYENHLKRLLWHGLRMLVLACLSIGDQPLCMEKENG